MQWIENDKLDEAHVIQFVEEPVQSVQIESHYTHYFIEFNVVP